MEDTQTEQVEVISGEVVEEEHKIRRGGGNWTKGMKSPNPNGRPKKELNLTAMSKDLMKAKADGDITKMQKLLNELYAIGIGEVSGAKVSDRVKAIQELFDRGFGKSKTILEMNTDTEFEVSWGDNDKDEIDWNSVGQLEAGGDEQDTTENQN